MKKIIIVLVCILSMFGCKAEKTTPIESRILQTKTKFKEEYHVLESDINVQEVGNVDGDSYYSFTLVLAFDDVLEFDYNFNNSEDELIRVVMTYTQDRKEANLELGLQAFLENLDDINEEQKDEFYKEVINSQSSLESNYESRNLFYQDNFDNFVFKRK